LAACVRFVCQVLSCLHLSLGDQTWHLVDVPALICGTGTHAIEFPLWNSAMTSDQIHTPHVLAFVRSSERPVTISYTVLDSANFSIEVASRTDELVSLGARRLAANASVAERRVRSTSGGSSGGRSGGRSGGGRSSASSSGGSSSGRSTGSGSSSRGQRSYSSASAAATARRRGIPSYYRDGDVSRRRADGETSYRRRGFQQAGSRRRMTGYDGERWGNRQVPQSGSYGFASLAQAERIFPNSHSSTGYGYAGASAFAALGAFNLAFSASALGLVAAAPQESRWSTLQGRGSTCLFDDYFQGDCSECQTAVWDDHKCYAPFTPAEDMNLDMIMNAGFIPADVTWPLLVRVTRVEGDDYANSRLCTSGDAGNRDLFVTITEVQELSEALEADSDSLASRCCVPLLIYLVPCSFMTFIL